MRRLLIVGAVLAIAGLVLFLLLTEPRAMSAADLPQHTPDPANGEVMFNAGGCTSCHSVPAGDKCEDPATKDKRVLGGGRCLKTPFGTFYVPNISPDPETGIGAWSDIEFVNAMQRGISPSGAHYYPSFPYTSYQRMRVEDLLDLKAFIDTLPAVKNRAPDHELALPFRLRRGLGLWKLLYLDGKPFVPDPAKSQILNRGAYLVEGPGHCGECHTPRNALGGKIESKHLAGGPAPEGDGWIPNITQSKDGLADWSETDIVSAFQTGLLPSFDSFGSSMVAVQQNLARLPQADLEAIAAYLKSLPAIENPRPKR